MQTTANRFTHQSWFPPSYPSLPLRAVLACASQTLMNITNTIYSVTEGSKLRQEPTVLRKEQSLTGVTSPISRQGLVLRELTWADCSQTEELPIAHTRPHKKDSFVQQVVISTALSGSCIQVGLAMPSFSFSPTAMRCP